MRPRQTLAVLERLAPSPGAAPPSRDDVPPLAVAFEDDHLAVVVKPQGVPTQVQAVFSCSSFFVPGSLFGKTILIQAVFIGSSGSWC